MFLYQHSNVSSLLELKIELLRRCLVIEWKMPDVGKVGAKRRSSTCLLISRSASPTPSNVAFGLSLHAINA